LRRRPLRRLRRGCRRVRLADVSHPALRRLPRVPSSPRRPVASRALVLWGPVALYALAIFVESSISHVPAFPSGFTDKDGHGLLYAGLAVLVLRAASGARGGGVRPRAPGATVALSARSG